MTKEEIHSKMIEKAIELGYDDESSRGPFDENCEVTNEVVTIFKSIIESYRAELEEKVKGMNTYGEIKPIFIIKSEVLKAIGGK
jgi:predicted nuclease of restriction endonuclease-like RecB superfamily